MEELNWFEDFQDKNLKMFVIDDMQQKYIYKYSQKLSSCYFYLLNAEQDSTISLISRPPLLYFSGFNATEPVFSTIQNHMFLYPLCCFQLFVRMFFSGEKIYPKNSPVFIEFYLRKIIGRRGQWRSSLQFMRRNLPWTVEIKRFVVQTSWD